MKKFTFLCSILAKTHWHHPYFLLLDFVFLQIKMWSLIRIKTRKPRALNKPVPQWKKNISTIYWGLLKSYWETVQRIKVSWLKKQMFRVVRNLGSAFNFQKKKRFIFKDGYQQPWFLETRGHYHYHILQQKLDIDQRTTNGRSIFCDVTSQIFPLMLLSGNSAKLLKNGLKNKWHYSCCIVILGILGTPKERESRNLRCKHRTLRVHKRAQGKQQCISSTTTLLLSSSQICPP